MKQDQFFSNLNYKRRIKHRYYHPRDKRILIVTAAPLIKRGVPLCQIAAIIQVPANTFYQWIARLNKEGIESVNVNGVTKRGDIGRKELELVLNYIKKYNIRNPTINNFILISKELKLQRKASTLYIYYRDMIKQKKL